MTAPADLTVASPPARPCASRPASPDQVLELQRRMRAAGLLSPRPGYYAAKITFNLLMGFSYGWWVGHHNKHHSNPNHLEKDSDITRRRSIFIPEQGPARRGRAKQFIVRHQHVLFYPLLTTESIGLRTESIKALTRKLPRLTAIEASLIAVHLGGLNYQIEHHLFPTMPRQALRRARPITIEYCSQIGLPYHEVGVFRSYAEVVIHLYRTTKAYQRTLAAA
jgi:fatty acid desaturase